MPMLTRVHHVSSTQTRAYCTIFAKENTHHILSGFLEFIFLIKTTKTVLGMEVEGVRFGRPQLRYMDTIRRYRNMNGLTDVNILDSKGWKSV